MPPDPLVTEEEEREMDEMEMIPKVILDEHADCCERLALALARQKPLGPESIRVLDGYAVLVGRENVPSEVWAAMSVESVS